MQDRIEKAAEGESTSTRLAAGLPVTRQAVTKHLLVLDRAGLVASHRRGREVRYAVRPDRLDLATRSMSRVAADWDRRLQAIKRIAEQARKTKTTVRRDSDGASDGGVARRLAGSTAAAVT